MKKRFSLSAFVVGLALVAASAAGAVQPDEMLSDPALEKRARNLSQELRCMVCQNQSIDDSDAPLARDLRVLVRERLQGGDSDREVINYLIERYGDFVLLKPRLTARTALLWGLPILAFVGGGFGVAVFLRRQRALAATAAGAASAPSLSADEQKRLAELIEDRR